MKKILVISFSDLYSDPRVNRQIRFLSQDYKVIATGFGDPKIDKVLFIPISYRKNIYFGAINAFQLFFRPFENWYWNQKYIKDAFKKLSNIDPDLIIANDVDTLPLAFSISKGKKIIFDAHEFSPREMEDIFFWKIFFQKYKTFLCHKYIPKVYRMITVSEGIAKEYSKEFNINPIIITNAPDFEDIQPILRDKNQNKIRLVYHGAAAPSRRIENIIRIMDYLDNHFELNLMLIETWPGYLNHLKRLSKKKPNINFLPPVQMRFIPKFLNQFDIGISLIEPTNFNFKHALPNKFFEYIQARLAIAIGPSIEMVNFIKKYDLGVISNDFTPKSLAEALMKFNYEKINYHKLQSHKAAKILSAETNKMIFLKIIKEALAE